MMASSPFSRAERSVQKGGATLALLALAFGCVGEAPTVVSCVLGTASCDGQCVDVEHNPLHCGGCGRACPIGEACVEGACACLGETCGEVCVAVTSHPDHCGACGRACPEGRFCESGVCSQLCSDGLTACGASCVDTTTAREHCGGCDAPCPLGAQCIEGACACRDGLIACGDRCVDVASDAAHCGGCDAPCDEGELCGASSCVLACGGEACAAGDAIWGRWLGAENAHVVVAGAGVTTSGDVVLLGTFAGTLRIGTGVSLAAAGARDLFVARLDGRGRPRWARSFGAAGATLEAFDLAVDGDDVWLVGSTQGTVDFDGIQLVGGGRDALVVHLAGDGAVVTAERFGGAGVERAKGIALLGGGAFAVGGSFTDVLERGGVTHAQSDGAADTDGFVMVVDAAGDVVWVAALEDAGAEVLQEVVDVSASLGTVAAAARIDGAAAWAGAAVLHVAGREGAVGSFAALDGTIAFIAQVTGVGIDAVHGVAVASDGVAVAGEHAGAATITGDGGQACALGALSGTAGADGLIAKLGDDGCPLWAHSVHGPGADRVHTIALGPAGDYAIAGHFTGTLSLGVTPVLDSTTIDDGFVMSVSAAGALSWARRFGGAVRVSSVVLDDTRVVVAGSYAGTVFFAPTSLASAASDDGFVATYTR